jgi:hypothetical protein
MYINRILYRLYYDSLVSKLLFGEKTESVQLKGQEEHGRVCD